MMLERGIACVSVGFPATGLTGGRVRFCLSAAHTTEMLDKVLETIDECGEYIGLKFSQKYPHVSFKEQKEMDGKFFKKC
jgi:serine palmitoyltransferase